MAKGQPRTTDIPVTCNRCHERARPPSAGFRARSKAPGRPQPRFGGWPFSPSREAEKAETFPGAGRSWTLKGAARLSGLLNREPHYPKGSSGSQSFKALAGCPPGLGKGA